MLSKDEFSAKRMKNSLTIDSFRVFTRQGFHRVLGGIYAKEGISNLTCEHGNHLFELHQLQTQLDGVGAHPSGTSDVSIDVTSSHFSLDLRQDLNCARAGSYQSYSLPLHVCLYPVRGMS